MRCGVHWKDASSSLGRASGSVNSRVRLATLTMRCGVHWKDASSSLGRASGSVSPFTLLDISLSLGDGGGGGGGGDGVS